MCVQKKMNIEHFTKHIASRKAEPIEMELKESQIEIPPDYKDAALNYVKNRAKGLCSLQEATIVSCDMEGDRSQWLNVSFNNEFEDADFIKWFQETCSGLTDVLDGEPVTSKNLMLSRFRKDYSGRDLVPIRLWKMDRNGVLQEYEGCLNEGTVVICSFSELKAYKAKDSEEIKIAADLHRHIVVVRKSKKRRRVIQYFSDGE